MAADRSRVYTVEEFAELSPNQRHAIVQASIVSSWDEVDPEFARKVLAAAQEENEKLRVQRAG